ncbi:MAG: flavin reductase family protein [Promethearchaeota archaeon]
MSKLKLGAKPFLFPMPTALIGSIVNDKPNFMLAAFIGMMNIKPPMISCGLAPIHLTVKGIELNKQFSVNIPTVNMVEIADYCGLYSGNKVDKSGLFDVFFGTLENAPLIQECPVVMECELKKSIVLGNDTLYLGEIMEIHCDENVMTDGKPDVLKIDPFVFTFPNNGLYSLGKRIGTGWKTGKNYKKQ